jgi:hypothetical protein
MLILEYSFLGQIGVVIQEEVVQLQVQQDQVMEHLEAYRNII